ncbi:ribbon-helix-helix domain-containing protein [Rhodoferax sp.]|uniref:ribbon-helix-helix domain-containing protein n=1 Tax=Rhodoferax sp. TaxID=50421 RepID=UPI00374D4610
MCEYFVKADPIQYEQRSRTVRIKNVLTSIRLENMVWDILAEMAEEEGCTTNALIAKFHHEILAQRGEVPNFASFLRVTCMRYLRRCMLSLEKQIPQPVPNVAVLPYAKQAVDAVPKPLAAVGR